MPAKQHKKLLIMNILDILCKYSDEDHRLSQRDIAEILENEYNMTADRKAIKRNLMNLLEFGYELEYSETIRMVPVTDKATGESVPVTFRAKKYILNEVIDWLGRDIEIISETENEFAARVRMNYEAMRCWALQYARHVRVLTPQKLVEQIKTDLRQSVENYEGGNQP